VCVCVCVWCVVCGGGSVYVHGIDNRKEHDEMSSN